MERQSAAITAFTIAFLLSPHFALGKPPNVGPQSFGRVFEANRSSLVRVESGREKPRWSTGFVIGAEGEIVFGIDKIPKQELSIEIDGAKAQKGELLGYDLGLSLAIGRMSAPSEKKSFAALRVASKPGLDARTWVIALTHDARGRPQPYAGIVDGSLERDVHRKTPIGVFVAPVSVPGTLGSPILSVAGELVGVVIESGDRKTRVVPIDIVAPFVKAVVLGRNRK